MELTAMPTADSKFLIGMLKTDSEVQFMSADSTERNHESCGYYSPLREILGA